jgi:hypothetical protein
MITAIVVILMVVSFTMGLHIGMWHAGRMTIIAANVMHEIYLALPTDEDRDKWAAATEKIRKKALERMELARSPNAR